MKKLAFLFVAVAAISFAACQDQTNNNESGVDSDSIAEQTEVVDTLCCDSACADTVVAE